MKAYKVWDEKSIDPCSTVVFAKNCREAKKLARSTDVCEDADYINIRVHRFPEMDKYYRGKSVIDWYNKEDREELVSLGWMCLETSEECNVCTARKFCGHWEDLDNETD